MNPPRGPAKPPGRKVGHAEGATGLRNCAQALFRADDRLRAGRSGTSASPFHPRNGAVPEGLERARARCRRRLCRPTGRWRAGRSSACGPNWRVTTDFHWFRWDDFVRADAAESDWLRFPLGIAALMEFILTGTVVKYFIIAWRYGGFFLSPLVYRARHDVGVDRADALCRGPSRPAVSHAARAASCGCVSSSRSA